jgi:aromatic amino acid aminotransferase I
MPDRSFIQWMIDSMRLGPASLTGTTLPDRFSPESNQRLPSSLKGAAQYLKTPGIISLGGGLPSSEYFPFEEFNVKVPVPGSFDDKSHHTIMSAGKHDLAQGKSDFDIATAFNYGQGYGSAQFLRWIVEHTEIIHSPPYQDWSCTMTVGSTSAIDMGMRMFCKPGDWILSEEFTFPTAVESAAPQGVKVAGVGVDAGGLRADALDKVLTEWDASVRGGPKPFILYTVPTGQNPTGSTQSAQRRKEIYAVAQKHDLIIFEDEPYYFLQMDPYTGLDSPAATPPASHADFLASLVPSYLSMDTDGRVMRLDSFSKVIAPGSSSSSSCSKTPGATRATWTGCCTSEPSTRRAETCCSTPANCTCPNPSPLGLLRPLVCSIGSGSIIPNTRGMGAWLGRRLKRRFSRRMLGMGRC